MTRLILTADSSSAGGLVSAGHADLAVPIELRMVWDRHVPMRSLQHFWRQGQRNRTHGSILSPGSAVSYSASRISG